MTKDFIDDIQNSVVIKKIQAVYRDVVEKLGAAQGNTLVHAMPVIEQDRVGARIDLYIPTRLEALEIAESMSGYDMPGQLNNTYDVEGPFSSVGADGVEQWLVTMFISSADIAHVVV